MARTLFPQGVLVTGTKTEAQQNTLKCLASNTSGTLFQAVFQREQLLAAIDVFQFDAETGWYSINEIKSSTEVKEEHFYDLAFQVVLLRQHGMPIRRASVAHLNPGYVRQGDLDIQQVFTTVDVTTRVDQISGDVIKEVQEARAYLLTETEPVGSASELYRVAWGFKHEILIFLYVERSMGHCLGIQTDLQGKYPKDIRPRRKSVGRRSL